MKMTELEEALAQLPEKKMLDLLNKVNNRKVKAKQEKAEANFDEIMQDFGETLKKIAVVIKERRANSLKCQLVVEAEPIAYINLSGGFHMDNNFKVDLKDVTLSTSKAVKQKDLKLLADCISEIIGDALYYTSLFPKEKEIFVGKISEEIEEEMYEKARKYGLSYEQFKKLATKLKQQVVERHPDLNGKVEIEY